MDVLRHDSRPGLGLWLYWFFRYGSWAWILDPIVCWCYLPVQRLLLCWIHLWEMESASDDLGVWRVAGVGVGASDHEVNVPSSLNPSLCKLLITSRTIFRCIVPRYLPIHTTGYLRGIDKSAPRSKIHSLDAFRDNYSELIWHRQGTICHGMHDGIMKPQISASWCLPSLDSGFRISNISGMEMGGLEMRCGNENYVGLSDEKNVELRWDERWKYSQAAFWDQKHIFIFCRFQLI